MRARTSEILDMPTESDRTSEVRPKVRQKVGGASLVYARKPPKGAARPATAPKRLAATTLAGPRAPPPGGP